MADYSRYLPTQAPLSTYIGLSPEEELQLKQYAEPDPASQRMHPMGGLALAGGDRYRTGMEQYLQSLQAGNIWRQEQMNQAINANLQEAATNQMGRLGPELLRQGDTSFMAGSDFARRMLPGITTDEGGPSDLAVEGDTNARILQQGKDALNVAQAANQAEQAGLQTDAGAFAQRYKLPVTRVLPTAVQAARAHAAAGGGKPIKTGTAQFLDKDPKSPTYGKLVTRYLFDTPTSGAAPVDTTPPAVNAGTTQASPMDQGTPVTEEELNDDQLAAAQNAAAHAEQNGYHVQGYRINPDDGSTELIVTNDAGDSHAFNLDTGGEEE